jgi:hypothetical protein
MRILDRQVRPGGIALGTLLLAAVVGAGCATQAAEEGKADTFPLGIKDLLPPQLVVELPPEAIKVIDPALLDKNLQPKELVVHIGAAEETPRPQPVAFPHKTHVQTLGMDCQYCHSGARKGIHAGVPSTQLCMGCHEVVNKAGRPELDKVAASWTSNQPIAWNKVHDEPDFVHFNHKPHVRAGVECSECHGQVEEMGVAQRGATLQMGWCLDCHAQHESIDENYGVNAELRRAELKDCYTCHK